MAPSGRTTHDDLTIRDILRRYTPDYIRKYPGQAVPQVQSTLAKIELCRTKALGTHRYYCAMCGEDAVVYNSCGCSQCPVCSGAKRYEWCDSLCELLIDGVVYYQVVFTLPDTLSGLALGNRSAMFGLLFRAAWQALKRTIEAEQGFEVAAAMVLHSWSQTLDGHIHIHALVPGGGPALDGDPRWITSCRPGSRPRRPKMRPKFWLVDSVNLRTAFRCEFLKGLKKLHAAGKLKLDGEEWEPLRDAAAFELFLKPLEAKEWVVFIQPPPKTRDGRAAPPEQLAGYLARYLTGGPISNSRLLSHEDGKVTFLARPGNETGGSQQQVPFTLDGIEFVRRWCLHIPPSRFFKSRRYGGFSNKHRERYLAESRQLLGLETTKLGSSTEPATASDTTPADGSVSEADAGETEDVRAPRCPCCGQRMERISSERRPSWRDTMSSPFRPRWYADG